MGQSFCRRLIGWCQGFHKIQFLLKEDTLDKDGEKPEDRHEDLLKEGEEHYQPPLPAQHCLPDKHSNGSDTNHEGLWIQI